MTAIKGNAGGLGGLLSREIIALKTIINSRKSVSGGLHTYQVLSNNGSSKRLHLRINEDGTGILFVDVTDVIHLSQAGCEIIKFLLDGLKESTVISIIKNKYNGDRNKIHEDVQKLARILNHFRNHLGECYTCGVSELMGQVPVFSTRVEAPYKIDIALTYGCNNQCPHCYNESNRFAMPSLRLEDWYKVFDKIAGLGIPHVILTGGEATLHPDFLSIVQYADQKGMIVGLNSNGRYLSHSPFMTSAAAAGLNHVQVTLGSCYEDVHNMMMGVNSFEQTVDGISVALESGIHVITNTTLMKSNREHVAEIIDFIYRLGIRTFAMNGMIYSGGGYSHTSALPVDEMTALIAKVKNIAENKGMRFLWYTPTEYCELSPLALDVGLKKCNAGEYSVCIEPNGVVLPCQSYYVSAGNFLTDPWHDIWHGDLFLSFREREGLQSQLMLPEKCWACPDLLVCGGGCRIERDAQNGIRVAETAGGGCIGCSNFSTLILDHERVDDRVANDSNWFSDELEPGFIPFPSQVSNIRRSSGDSNFEE